MSRDLGTNPEASGNVLSYGAELNSSITQIFTQNQEVLKTFMKEHKDLMKEYTEKLLDREAELKKVQRDLADVNEKFSRRFKN